MVHIYVIKYRSSCEKEYICCSSLFLLLATVLGIFYASPYEHVLGEYVTAGTAIGTHVGVHCAYSACMTDHVHFAKFVNGKKEDPTPNMEISEEVGKTNPPQHGSQQQYLSHAEGDVGAATSPNDLNFQHITWNSN